MAQLDRLALGLGRVIGETLERRAPVRRYETDEQADGTVLGVSTTLLERSDPPSVTAIFQDITERKRLEALRRRAERLEAVAEQRWRSGWRMRVGVQMSASVPAACGVRVPFPASA